MTLEQYLKTLDSAFRSHDGRSMARLLDAHLTEVPFSYDFVPYLKQNLDFQGGTGLMKVLVQYRKGRYPNMRQPILLTPSAFESRNLHLSLHLQRDVDRDCASRLRGSLAGVTAGVLKSLSASHEGRADDAHKHYIAALESFLDGVFVPEGAWVAPCLYTMVSGVRKLAKKADWGSTTGRLSDAGPSYGEPDMEEEGSKSMVLTTHTIMKAFRLSINDRSNEASTSRKACALHLAIDMFKHYSDLKNLRMCNNIRGVLEQHWAVVEPMSTKADWVSYRYYVGLLKISEDKYKEAETDLELALRHCHKDARNNKRRILNNLVPLKLRLGIYPSSALLEKYDLTHFNDFSTAIRTGDVRSFNGLMVKWERVFITKGTYLLMEKCLMLVYRNLVKKIVVATHAFKIPLRVVQFAFLKMEHERDVDEIECILANLIFRNLVKGYISHKAKFLVMASSVEKAFPKISLVTA